MASYSYNRFKSTTVFGNFYNSDISGIIADAIFDRNLTVKGNTKCNNYILSSDLPIRSILFSNSYSPKLCLSNIYLTFFNLFFS